MTTESYLDSLLNSVTSDGKKSEDRMSVYSKTEKRKKEELPEDFFADAEDDELLDYNIFDEPVDNDELDQMIEQELSGKAPEQEPLFDNLPEEEPAAEEPVPEEPEAEEPAADLPDDLAQLFAEQPTVEETAADLPDDLAQLFAIDPALEELFPEQPEETPEEELSEAKEETATARDFMADNPFAEILDENDIVALDDLFQEIDAEETVMESQDEADALQQILADDLGGDELLAVHDSSDAKGKKGKKKKKDDRPFLVRLFGNVPVDPSKIKHEPTPEEIEAEKKAKAEKKKQSKEEKKAASDEKKTAATKEKEEKARQKQLEKEEKKARKMEQAKLILEDMKDTRINRAGATVVFIAFAMIAFLLIAGTNMITYEIAVSSAEKSFKMALNNSVSYYNDAYDQIYGLALKEEDVDFGNKVMVVMYVNKQLNSYNSFVAIGDEVSALDSLLKGINRYENWSIQAALMGYDDIQADLDYVCSQILLELDKHYGVTLDEATLLSRMIRDKEALEYSREVYKIIDERVYGRTSDDM